jgi:hypothetical protein
MDKIYFMMLLFWWGGYISAQSKKAERPVPPLELKGGKLSYTPDSLGNRIPDFSYAGYRAGEMPVPQLAATIIIPHTDDDATEILQNAIDYIGNKVSDERGIRGVILLQSGTYRLSGNLNITRSGIILRGAGMGDKGTRLVATGKDRRTLIQIKGQNDLIQNAAIEITDGYVPVNAMTLNIAAGSKLKAGDKIFIRRPSTAEWIRKLGTDHFGGGITALGWKAGEQDLYWDRTILSVEGGKITIDAPLTTALDKKYGSGFVIPYTWDGRIHNVGIENLSCISEYDLHNPKDEAHSWIAISMENLCDAWVRNVTFRHFAGSAVAVLETAKRITVENCKSFLPVSEIGGGRRHTFFTSGQQCLFQRLYSEQGCHDFAVGFCASGPNVFVQCESERPHGFSGPLDRWASGVLFDIVNINGNALSYKNRMYEAQGAGWNAANSVFWQCAASLVECFAPPTAQNWAFGVHAIFSGDGYWNDSNHHIHPRSLYYKQLEERLGEAYHDRAHLLPVSTEASSSPSVAVAAALSKQAHQAPVALSEWIDSVVAKQSFPANDEAIRFTFKETISAEKRSGDPLSDPNGGRSGNHRVQTDPNGRRSGNHYPLSVTNGWLSRNHRVQTGSKHTIRWWSGSVRPAYLSESATPHITRFVPGRTGTGLTDDLDSVASWMREKNMIVIDHNYGLWYDRRRDDHERVRRMDGEVWPPFYEQPFARSGQGVAYDGLSKYDITRYNEWYWSRLRRFARIADKNGLILMHQNYFQHNLLEAGAHWTDSPWRPANNINDTGFPEPPPYAGDKRIFLAEQFYDIHHPVRRALHRAYIRQCLDNFRGTNSVIQLIGEEYTGPLHFVRFWLDVIAEWEAETGEEPLIALSATKDVQDAILADPVRSDIIDIIDIRYWFYRSDGSTYAPEGGLHLAPRQHARLEKPGSVDFRSTYRAVGEYRRKFPDKAVTFYSSDYPQQAWAVFMAQGSLACLPAISDDRFLRDALAMEMMPEMNVEGQYVLGNPTVGFILYSDHETVSIDLSGVTNKYDLYRIDAKTGEIRKDADRRQIRGGSVVTIQAKEAICWLIKK